jgi:large repetitive protein
VLNRERVLTGQRSPEVGGGSVPQRWLALGARLLVLLGLQAMANVAQAVQYNCSEFPIINGFHTIDGNPSLPPTVPPSVPAPDNIKIDADCRIRNYSPEHYPSGINTNFSFINNAPSPFLVIFDNVFHTGNMSCNTVAGHRIWFTNGSSSKILSGNCQSLLIPVEMIDKRATDGQGNLIASATVGVPFTYSLAVPVLFDAGTGTVLEGQGSLNDISKISIRDDISQSTLGVALTYLGHTVAYRDTGGIVTPMTEGVDYVFTFVGDVLGFDIINPDIVPAGAQLYIDIEVVLDDSPLNVAGSSFVNIATWEFAREIEGDFYDPLPGENGRAELVTISQPNLFMSKTSLATAINFSDVPSFTLSIQNGGGFDAWNVRVEDELPLGMCLADPTPSVTAQVLAADNSTVLRTLDVGGGHVVVSYDEPGCLLEVVLTDSAGAIAPTEYLRITYTSQLDPPGSPNEASDGDVLTNVAAATQWFNDASTNLTRVVYSRVRTDGTPGVVDHEDAYSVTAGLTGYYFEKVADNLTTGAIPTQTATPGDRLRYRIRLFNLDQIINGITITDQLDLTGLDPATVAITSCPAQASCSFNAGTGVLTVTGDGVSLDAAQGSDVSVFFEVDVRASAANGYLIANQAELVATDGLGDPFMALSDDPNVNGVADPEVIGDEDPTVVAVVTPGPLSKINPAQTEFTIGEQFTYRITVPETPVASPLYDVRILDDLSASGVDLGFVSATVVAGGTWVLTNTGASSDLIIENIGGGIDIPANGQVVIDITVELLNTLNNQSGDTFTNTASYTYNRANGDDSLQRPGPPGPNDTTAPLTIIEPEMTISKTVANVTPGKAASDPAAGGDILEYTLTMPNIGSATAYDVSVRDILPEGIELIDGSATAQIGGNPVPGFIVTPTEPDPRIYVWGSDNGNDNFHVPVGESLVLTFQVNVTDASIASFENNALVDWTSLLGGSNSERSGAECPLITLPDDYCAGPAVATITTVDTTALSKTLLSDSWDDAFSTATDGTVRVGDTLVYRLALTLREGLTSNVVITDTLPAGLEFDGVVAINGETLAPYSAVAPFAHNDIAAPAVLGNVVTWAIGDIFNSINNDPSDDVFIIDYRVRVLNEVLAHVASTTLTNAVAFSHDTSSLLTDSVDIEVRQPVMVNLTKTDQFGNSYPNSATPLEVDIATDILQFTLEMCNEAGATAPAYDLQLIDTLASELDETSIANLQVTVNGALQTDGVDYLYTPPAVRGGEMVFALNTPVAPGQCAEIQYDIGFHADVVPNQLWANSVTATEFWSLPTPTTDGQQYAAVGPTEFWMTNISLDPLPVKTLVSPLTEATIGETVVYQIVIPAINAARNDVEVTDTLPAALVYDGATITLDGNPVAFTDSSVAPDQVSLLIAQISAGQEALITLNTYVANTLATNAGDTFSNTATYSYSGYAGSALTSAPSDSITLVEPQVAVVKSVAPMDPPVAGDVLTYTVDLTASAGANFSDAYDLVLTDTLSLGLAYVAGSATVAGAPVEPSITGDGVTLAQTLVWTDIDVAEGATITLTYDVQVQNNVTPGQILANTATATWTSLPGINSNERDGSGGVNDYIASDSTNLGAPDNTTFSKIRLSDTFNAADNNVRVGDRIEFELRIGLQEGTHNDLVLTDTLPTGLVYEGMVSADFFGTPGVANPVVVGQNLTWDLGTVVNPADGDPDNDFLVIVYSARVGNEVLPHTPTTQPLFNSATLDYTVAGVPAPTRNDSVSVNVLQPNLAITKAVSTVGGDNEVVAGETITYTVEITNNGDAPAYDVVLVDTLPPGLRQSGILTTDVSLVSGPVLPSLAPSYDSGTGVASWNFDDGNADTYTIPVGDTLRVVYTITADADIGASLGLDNLAQVTLYYSFDNDAVPSGGAVSEREVYGPTNTASATVTTPGPGALEKVESVSEVVVGEHFTYRITVPAVPVDTALFDVRILDDLAASAADLRFVSVDRAPATPTLNTLAWTPVNTGNDTQLVIEDITSGIDIPAGEQIAVDITIEVLDTATNVIGLLFSNSADYTYNRIDNDSASEAAGLPGSAGDTVIIGPDTLVMNKSGPATLGFGPAGSFTLDLENTSNARAWDITITDLLPNPVNGGMCQVEPEITSARVFANDGVTPISAPLVAGVDYSTGFSAGSPTCTFTFTGESAAASLAPGERLIITYDAWLDDDNPANIELTNIAGATEWFSQDTAGAGATGETRTYSAVLTDGTPGTDDHQDAWTLTTEPPELIVEKTAFNVSTGVADGTAWPGDTLRYTITITNSSQISLPDFSLTDDLGALNAAAVFQTGTLGNLVVPAGADISLTNPSGGSNGAGLLEVRNLALGPQGSATETVVVEFEVTLVSVIDNGTVVYNQGSLSAFGSSLALTDDPAIAGTDDPTEVLIMSSPQWRVEKISEDLTGDPAVLEPGDVLRYTLTVVNIGDEDAVNVMLTDALPAFTSYVPGSTTLNGASVADAAGGTSPLAAGILINAPVNTTAGFMPADATAPANHVATITFRVVVDPTALDGTVISNQGFVASNGAGGTVLPLQPSDDPNTDVPNDPTRDIVGALPLLNAQKTVALFDDVNGDGVVNPGDTLRYTITISNNSTQPATDLVLNDPVPADTTYVANSITVDGAPYADGPGLPGSVDVLLGTLAGNSSVVVEFDVVVNPAVPSATVISNQGVVDSAELPARLTDADGIEENGFQPTNIVVGSDQQLSIIKSASVVGGGVALAGSALEYLIQITNTGATAATDVTISDDLNAMIGAGQATFVVGSATLNGGTAGISYVGQILTADYAGTFGNLAPGASISVRFRVLLDDALVEGDVISNTGTVFWNTPALTASSTVNTPIGAIPGVASLTGTVWHDANFDTVLDAAERRLAGWTVRLLRGSVVLGSTQTDSNGVYRFNGVASTVSPSDFYTIEFRAPGAGLNTAMLGMASSAFTNELQRITDINAGYGMTVSGLNLPIDPNGVVYDAILRTPVVGATLVLVNSASGNAVSPACFDDTAQQGQVTLASGYYKFDLNFADASCPTGIDYLVQVTPPGGDYTAGPSVFIPPLTDASTAAYSVPLCSNDAIPGGRCEAQLSEFQPATSVSANDPATGYYLHLSFGNAQMPDESQIFNNHIPVDPTLANTVSISKTAGVVNVTRGQLVPYVITVRNTLPVALADMNVVDVFPAGFKYVTGSARLNDVPTEPDVAGRQLSWNGLELATNTELTIKVLLIVGGGVSEGEYVNRVQVFNIVTGAAVSPEATATVRVVPDPTFDCTDIIGKVFDDANLNGVQDEGERGLPGVRLVTARGLIATTDKHGRYHITCAAVPDENRGSNFIIKIDDRSLPTGYRVTTENPRVQRITRGKMAKFNFGAALHRVVRLDMAHGVFEPDSTEMRLQWTSRMALLLKELETAPSILRLAYMAENEPADLVERRLQAIREKIRQLWIEADNPYELVIETEVFWRTGAPPARRAIR